MKEHPFCLSGIKNKNILVQPQALLNSLAATVRPQTMAASQPWAAGLAPEPPQRRAAPRTPARAPGSPFGHSEPPPEGVLHFIKYIADTGACLFVLLAAQSGVGVGDLDGELSGSLHDYLPVLGRHIVSNLRAVRPVRTECASGSAPAAPTAAVAKHSSALPPAASPPGSCPRAPSPSPTRPDAGARLQSSSTRTPFFLQIKSVRGSF